MASSLRSLLGGCLAGLAGLAMAGCGARSILELAPYQDNGSAGGDGGVDGSLDAPIADGPVYDHVYDNDSCNPAKCGGCCTQDGKCVAGMASDACGIDGYACVDCTEFNASCNAGTHQCGASEKCSPATCLDGCCDNQGKCVSGADTWACGSGGTTCNDCGSYGMYCDPYGKYCTTQPGCSPSTCSGCCTSWGSCEWGGDTSACGMGGQACQDCSWTGTQCDPYSYQCLPVVESCGPSNCPYGCCDQYSGQCLSGVDQGSCGSAGSVCQSCTMDNETCTPSAAGGGICQLVNSNCGPWNCSGCCDQYSGQCNGGVDSYACGSGGAVCQYCADSNATCEATWNGGGQCILQTETCGPNNCGGCCDYSTWPPQCVWGGDTWACGYGGNACSYCDASQKCEVTPMGGGQCTGTNDCGPWNCGGCCDYSYYPAQCMWGGDSWACGANGDACYPCGPGTTCQSTPNGGGYCVGYQDGGTDCGPWNCGGCCNINTYPPICETGTNPWACGSQGQQCTTCPPGGQCVLTPGGATCSMPPPDAGVGCGPWNCNGCCSNTYPSQCLPGLDPYQCGSGGATCWSCAPNQTCIPTSVGGGMCMGSMDGGIVDAQPHPIDAASCGPWNCQGCCTANGTCVPGQSNLRCGTGGQQCTNCTTNNGTCNAGQCVYPNTCPAAYGGCPSYESVTAPYTKPGACSQATLDKAVAVCAGTPTPPACGQYLLNLQQTDPACGQCLWQFTGPNATATCVAPYLTDTCNHAVACTFDCLDVACSQCPTDQNQTCRDSALWNSGTCSGYTQGAFCYQSALQGAGSFCTWNGDYGKWIYVVGNHYCGTGSP